ncbi:MAG: hypothetical protein AB1568_13065 [Thermodesulfobacteriota bacterium]
MRPFLLLLALLLPLAGCRPAPDPAPPDDAAPAITRQYRSGHGDLSLRISRDRATVAEPIEVDLELSFPEGWQAELAPISSPDLPATAGETDPAKLDDNHRLRQHFRLRYTPFLPGNFSIGPLRIVLTGKDGGGTSETIRTDGFPVTVTTLLTEDDGQPADILPPLELPHPIWPYLAIAAGALALGLLATGLYLRRRRRPRPAPPPLPPHRLAERQLDELAGRGLPEQGQGKLFHILLSDILRSYVEARFAIHAPEQTTEEFLAQLRHDDRLAGEHKDSLKRLLNHCDMVKFARRQTTAADCDQSLTLCRDFVRDTIPPPAPGGTP